MSTIFQGFLFVMRLPKLHIITDHIFFTVRLGTDQFRSVDVMVMMLMATPALHKLLTSVWKPWIH